MRILIAEDEVVSRTVLEKTLRGWGHEVTAVEDGEAAKRILLAEDSPSLAILDWVMPGIEGPEICRMLKVVKREVPVYTILLTAKDRIADLVAGLESGADDFISKLFDPEELRSRINVGARMIELQRVMADRVRELEASLERERTLLGLLPICAWCKHVRKDDTYWQSVESYFAEMTDVRFTHGICPDCLLRESSKAE